MRESRDCVDEGFRDVVLGNSVKKVVSGDVPADSFDGYQLYTSRKDDGVPDEVKDFRPNPKNILVPAFTWKIITALKPNQRIEDITATTPVTKSP